MTTGFGGKRSTDGHVMAALALTPSPEKLLTLLTDQAFLPFSPGRARLVSHRGLAVPGCASVAAWRSGPCSVRTGSSMARTLVGVPQRRRHRRKACPGRRRTHGYSPDCGSCTKWLRTSSAIRRTLSTVLGISASSRMFDTARAPM